MLAVTNKDYYIPRYDEQQEGWLLIRKNSEEMVYTKRCNYTLFVNRRTGEVERLTFMYDGASVKPSGRTLRVFGAKNTSWYTSHAARNQENYLDLGRNAKGDLAFIRTNAQVC